MSKTLTKIRQLPVLAQALTQSFNDGEKIYLNWCGLLGEARESFDDDDDFWEWVEDTTPFKKTTAYRYLQVQREVIAVHSGAESAIKSMPFNALLAIAKQNLSKSTKNKAIKLYAKHEENPEKHARPTTADIKRLVRAESPRAPSKPKISVMSRPAFDDRLTKCLEGSATNPFYLFALIPEAHYTDGEILVRHWKGKYHPDKGGSNAQFNIITELGIQLINTLKESS